MGVSHFGDLRGDERAGGGILRGVPFSDIGRMGNPQEAVSSATYPSRGSDGRGVFVYFDDFFNYEATTPGVAANGYVYNDIGGGASGTVVQGSLHGGTIRFDSTDATSGNGAQVESTALFVTPTPSRFYGVLARLKISSATDTNWAVGLAPAQGGNDILTGTAVTGAAVNYILLKSGGAGVNGLALATEDTAGGAKSLAMANLDSTFTATSDDAYFTVGFRVNCGSTIASAGTSIEVYHNGRRRFTALGNSTLPPGFSAGTGAVSPDAVPLSLILAVTNKSANQRTADFDWVCVFGERA